MGGRIVIALLALPVGAYAFALDWTRPGPQQTKHRVIVAVCAAGLFLLTIALMVAGGILEQVNETPESRENQFGTGWSLLTMVASLPTTVLAIALFLVAISGALPMVARVIVSGAAAIVFGIPLWFALLYVILVPISE